MISPLTLHSENPPSASQLNKMLARHLSAPTSGTASRIIEPLSMAEYWLCDPGYA
jgi:hypothetical protein